MFKDFWSIHLEKKNHFLVWCGRVANHTRAFMTEILFAAISVLFFDSSMATDI
jgi:hypothetical protein